MDKEEFKALSHVKKLFLIMDHGRLVLERKEENQLMKLFVYNLFYVEVTYLQKENKVTNISTPDMDYIVDEYLDTINVKDLLDL
ncbi:MAG: hypothetical protein B7C24_08255 [Bacteroidetes bacterium 4572_77]|nr:MAG: hypothetical protein B7C24_08255 [Bacteroidetes bacterium 4572_77]